MKQQCFYKCTCYIHAVYSRLFLFVFIVWTIKKDSLLDHLMSVSHLKCSFYFSSTKGNCASTSDTSPHISRIKKTISILAQCESSPNIAISVDRQSKKVEHTRKTVSALKLKRSKYCFSLFCFCFVWVCFSSFAICVNVKKQQHFMLVKNRTETKPK